jgi:hypothetical protein
MENVSIISEKEDFKLVVDAELADLYNIYQTNFVTDRIYFQKNSDTEPTAKGRSSY